MDIMDEFSCYINSNNKVIRENAVRILGNIALKNNGLR